MSCLKRTREFHTETMVEGEWLMQQQSNKVYDDCINCINSADYNSQEIYHTQISSILIHKRIVRIQKKKKRAFTTQ